MKNENHLFPNDPEYTIGGMLFSYRKALDAFMERDDPSNKIMMSGIWEDNTWTQFFFDSRARNIYNGSFPDGKRPAHVKLVILPSLPYCERHGIHVKSYHEKLAESDNQRNKESFHQSSGERHRKGRRI
jgi:hypothetical protein